jgi:hypothetical protein
MWELQPLHKLQPHCCVCERKKKYLDDCDNLDLLVTYQDTAQVELVLRREQR